MADSNRKNQAVTDEKAGDAAQLPALLRGAVDEDRLPRTGCPDRWRLGPYNRWAAEAAAV